MAQAVLTFRLLSSCLVSKMMPTNISHTKCKRKGSLSQLRKIVDPLKKLTREHCQYTWKHQEEQWQLGYIRIRYHLPPSIFNDHSPFRSATTACNLPSRLASPWPFVASCLHWNHRPGHQTEHFDVKEEDLGKASSVMKEDCHFLVGIKYLLLCLGLCIN